MVRLGKLMSSLCKGFKPPEKLTVSEWADKYRKLSPESSAETGTWRTTRTPYLKEPMDAFNDPKVDHIVMVASSQVGKSECINNMIGYAIDQDPSSILFIQPTTVDAKEYSRLRIAPMIRDCPVLRKKVAAPKSRDSGNTILQKAFPGGIITMCGSTEAHALASKPVRYLFGDERDRWAVSAGREGDPWTLATARQITYYNKKAVEVSTPTIKGDSPIASAYMNGTQEKYCVACPHCGEYNDIQFDNIRFEKEESSVENEKVYKVSNIIYVCPRCGGVSTEQEIKHSRAKWIAANPGAYQHGTRSFWLTSWVSPWATWESAIVEYLQAIGNSQKMQVVYNTRFGLLFENRGDLEDEDSVMARREEYNAELPDGVLLLTMGVDTQDDRMEYEVVGHGHFGETWGIKKGVIMGRPDTDEVWQALDDIAEHIYRFENGIGLRISLTFIDEGGHFTQEVRQRCAERRSKKFFAIKGRGGDGIPYTGPPKKQKIVIRGKAVGMCQVFEIGVDAGKAMIMDNIRVQTPGSKYCHFPKRDDYGAAYFKGLLSEHLVYKTDKKGQPRKNPWQWEKIPGHERNEPLDCRNYALAAAKAMEPDYDALERRLKGTSRQERTPVATAVRQPREARPRRRNSDYDEW